MSSPIKPFWNPYLAGIAIGLVLILSFFLTGRGLGSSGAFKRLSASALHQIAPTWTEDNASTGKYFQDPQKSPFSSWIVFLVLGTAIGGSIGVITSKRFTFETIHGPRTDKPTRWILAAFGGVLSGIAAQIARGCTSGQAITGGGQLALGSWVFMLSMFAGAYGLAYLVRKQWI